jgi:hypothetical protein
VNEDVWDWLRGCITCGKKHERRDLGGNQVTWADPGDGHPYRRRTNADMINFRQNMRKGSSEHRETTDNRRSPRALHQADCSAVIGLMVWLIILILCWPIALAVAVGALVYGLIYVGFWLFVFTLKVTVWLAVGCGTIISSLRNRREQTMRELPAHPGNY